MYGRLLRGGVHRELPCWNHLQRRAMFVRYGRWRTRLQRIGDLLWGGMHSHRHGRELWGMRTHLRGLGRMLRRHVSQHQRRSHELRPLRQRVRLQCRWLLGRLMHLWWGACVFSYPLLRRQLLDLKMPSARLRAHYTAFLREGRILLTGHSHQAWPDVARAAQLEAFDDAALHVDEKWGPALEAAEDVRRAVATRIQCTPAEVALASNTHELITRFLSALDWKKRPRIVSTRGEFHSIYRQLSRLAEEGMEVVWVDPLPADSLAQRLSATVDAKTAGVLVSNVLFETSSCVPGLAQLAKRCALEGAQLLVDSYHAFNVVPFAVSDLGGELFVVGGGYKYAQWGEGCCFLRVPSAFEGRPIYTGWFSDFDGLSAPRDGRPVQYGPRPAERFAGSTYDPTSHYRARRVARFFDEQGLDVDTLRRISLTQTSQLIEGLAGFDVRTPKSDEARGGFVSVHLENASEVSTALAARGIHTDVRGSLLRLGPAPYTTASEIEVALQALRSVSRND